MCPNRTKQVRQFDSHCPQCFICAKLLKTDEPRNILKADPWFPDLSYSKNWYGSDGRRFVQFVRGKRQNINRNHCLKSWEMIFRQIHPSPRPENPQSRNNAKENTRAQNPSRLTWLKSSYLKWSALWWQKWCLLFWHKNGLLWPNILANQESDEWRIALSRNNCQWHGIVSWTFQVW